MRLIAALLLLVVPIAAWAMYRPEEEPIPEEQIGPDTVPDILPPETFLESIGLMTGKQTRGERNNNPGNIRISAAAWLGKVPGGDAAFETFVSPESGIRALAITLKTYQQKYGLRTVQQIVNRWAPPSENNTSAYVRAVASAVGVQANDPVDLNNPDVLRRLVAAIIAHENGRNIYSLAAIDSGISMA